MNFYNVTIITSSGKSVTFMTTGNSEEEVAQAILNDNPNAVIEDISLA